MTISYAEPFDSFTTPGASGGWVDYDIHTLKGLPKGAIVCIIATNVLDGAEDYVGVRTDGSGVDKRLLLHEAEDGGLVTARFLATVDPSTGLIEVYDTAQAQTYYIVSYWTGITWTETWIDLNVIKADELTWVDRNLFSSDSVPKGSVCLASLVNRAGGNEYKIGARTDGSALSKRFRQIHEAEGGGVNALSMFVKTSEADGIIEIYCEDEDPDCSVIIQGYFGADMDFEELWTQKQVTVSDVWQEFDLTGDLDQDGRVVDFILGHVNIDNEAFLGVRGGDSSLDRFINEHEAEGYGKTGFSMSAQSNADGIVALYAGHLIYDVFDLSGYFIFAAPTAWTKTLTEPLGLSDVYSRTWTVYRTYSELLGGVDTVIPVRQVVKVLTELLGLSDTVFKSPSIVKSELLGLVDVYSRTWTIQREYSELLGLVDTYSRTWTVYRTYSELLALADAVSKEPSKTFPETLGLLDSVTKSPSILKSEALALVDTYSRVQSIRRTYTELLGLLDSDSKGVALITLTETLGITDTFLQLTWRDVEAIVDELRVVFKI